MAKAERRGDKWRCRVYVKDPDGTKHRVSFTADTRVEAERQAREFEADKSRRSSVRNLTVGEVVDMYIESKSNVLSPSTVCGYLTHRRNYISEIQSLPLRDLTSNDLQKWINSLSLRVSPKTVRLSYGLLSSSVAQFEPDRHFRVTFPPRARKATHAPSEADVRALIEAASPWMKKAIVLASLYTLRRGEICALRYADVNAQQCRVSIHAAMVLTPDGEWIYRPRPKNDSSFRVIDVAPEVIALLGSGAPADYVVGKNPRMVTNKFCLLRDRVGVDCRFHDLRHFAASIREALGIPRSLTAEVGGWNPSSHILDDVYSDTLDDRRAGYNRKLDAYFGENFLQSGPESGPKNS